MADIALGSAVRVVNVALAIKTAVDTAKQNKKDCVEIGKLAALVNSHTERLKKKTEAMADPAMRDALEAMADCLDDALLLIAKCNGKCFLLRYLKASDMSKQLRRANDEISKKMLLGIFATCVDTNIALGQRSQYAGQAENPRSSQPRTDQARPGVTKNDKGKTMVATVRRAESDPLSGIAQFSLSQLEAATNDFSEDSYDKRGYYKGVLLHNGLDVVAAIKKFSVSNDLELQHELSIRAKLQHRNIVKLLGYAKVEERPCFLVEEYMPNAKSLESIINGMSPTSRLDWPSCFKIIQGIAKGLHYLHKQWVLYMDLKPASILVRSDMDPVIVNFGLSVVLDGDDDTIPGDALAGTLGYVAPEKIRRANVSLKSDVFSFGVILLEMITGRRVSPFDDLPEWSSIEMIRSMKGLFDPALADESQLMKINRCREVGLKCIEWDPKCRPTMADVLEMLNS
ncbi:hypothetical protein SEVIR_8G235700v4 [Setaria viridis]|uniref:Protein kinase domain-containing protein n=1 Tax=Setaria viridis TaxID=4556 RepID=A0A4U6TIQ5_SETVI|nr:cysteine-rich receptor-like protein kinase 8 isoform X2 [Setaria viridis]TKW02292.1 hypothetical protein SEVIR_8G235700v2 [Setaria viridis]TKW02298.1 hypothetical protein SEVIR_8G235700v2 [Setaria viridis]TKW02306.1 hypothetical protein SEVIR_8G235700v2 [Setaria viridis]